MRWPPAPSRRERRDTSRRGRRGNRPATPGGPALSALSNVDRAILALDDAARGVEAAIDRTRAAAGDPGPRSLAPVMRRMAQARMLGLQAHIALRDGIIRVQAAPDFQPSVSIGDVAESLNAASRRLNEALDRCRVARGEVSEAQLHIGQSDSTTAVDAAESWRLAQEYVSRMIASLMVSGRAVDSYVARILGTADPAQTCTARL